MARHRALHKTDKTDRALASLAEGSNDIQGVIEDVLPCTLVYDAAWSPFGLLLSATCLSESSLLYLGPPPLDWQEQKEVILCSLLLQPLQPPPFYFLYPLSLPSSSTLPLACNVKILLMVAPHEIIILNR